jgi:hypothetical protein
VVAGNAQYGFAEAREDATKMFVAARIVLHQVAGHQDGVADREVSGGVRKCTLECLECVDAAQRSGGITKQMWIGELDDSNGAHSFELYKHAGARRVMRVTPRFTALKRGEPGRKLPGKKCESASVYCDPRKNGKSCSRPLQCRST